MFCCHADAPPVPRPHPHQLLLLSLIRQRFTCHSASLQSIASSIGSHGTWLRGMPQRVQFIKLNTTVALCSSCSTGQWQLLPCSRMLYISLFLFLPFLLFLSLSSLCSLLSAIVCISFRIPYPVCRYATMPYAAVSRFLIYAIPCMCHISAAKHAAHACGAWLQQKYHKKCHKCST